MRNDEERKAKPGLGVSRLDPGTLSSSVNGIEEIEITPLSSDS